MILLTGAAGFIGFHLARRLLDAGKEVLGVDDLNAYYPVSLKQARLAQLKVDNRFRFLELGIEDHDALTAAVAEQPLEAVVHLAAQAGVRYSLENPFAYIRANLAGHASILELCRHHQAKPWLLYASSSSVYGGNTKVPFAEEDRVDDPVSLYAATKRSDELMSYVYARLYGVHQIGLRFFTVYGPWGRPDMAYWSFTEKILRGEPIRIFNHGDMRRDFTYVDDVVGGLEAILQKGPCLEAEPIPHRIYNIGNNRPVALLRFVEILETCLGKKAQKVLEPMQPGDVQETYADIARLGADYGFVPGTPLEEGLPRFVEWFRGYHAL